MSFQPLLFSGFVIGQSSGGGGSGATIGGPVTGGVSGSVLFINPTGILAQDNSNFNFNDTTHALTITGVFSSSNFSGTSSGTNTGDVTLGTANGLSLVGQVLSLALSSTSTTGSLSSTDWNTFNSKQPAGSYVLTSQIGAANGVASLDSGGKVPVSQLPATVMEYQGSWNPSTNTPTLSDGTGTNGNVYYVSAAFSGPISGLTDPSMHNFQIGDIIIYSTSIGKWQLTTPAAGVQSVNGLQGVVVLTQGNLTDSTSGADGISVTGGTNAVWGTGTSLSQLQSSATQNGYLSSADWSTFNSRGTGSVTSVNLALPSSVFSTSGGPVTTSGTLTGSFNVQSANTSFMGPSTGSAAVPTFRIILNSDLESITTLSSLVLPASQLSGTIVLTSQVSGILPIANGGTNSGTTLSNNKVMVSTSGAIVESATTTTQLSFLDATSSIQTQLNGKQPVGSYPIASSGDINEMQFTAADNEPAALDVTGFTFSNATVRSFDATVSIVRNNTYAAFKLYGIQKASSSWEMSQVHTGDETGITFSITGSGQIQYTSSSTGFTANIHFRAISTSV